MPAIDFTEPSLPGASDRPDGPIPNGVDAQPDHPAGPARQRDGDSVPDHQRAGWGSPGDPARDRRGLDDRRNAGDRRRLDQRADDRYATYLRPQYGSETPEPQVAEPPFLRVPQAGVLSGPSESAAGAGRLFAVLLVVLVAFAAGIAVDQAAFGGTTAVAPSSPARTFPASARPSPTTPPRASAAPASLASGQASPGAGATPNASPITTPGPTIGPGATVPPNAPANLGIVWDALRTIQEHWVRRGQLNPTDLTYGILNGLVDSLGDPGHTVFLTPAEVKSSSQSLSGQITGIGVYLGVQAGAPFVQSVISGSPASNAGVLPGDRIIAIDGTSAENLSIEEIARLIRGEEGTPVALTLLHPSANTPVVITITRAKITVAAVTWAMIPGTSLAFIQIAEFSTGTTDQFVTALRGARQASARGVILDLRNNPGGYVDDAIGVASQFLSSGTVYVRRTADGNEVPVPARPGGLATDIPLVVLVDYGSASSAEITAGALQDNKRGTLIGTRTYGTGTVLNTFGLPDGSAIRLGVEEWLTPSGRAIFPNGIQPDEEVDLADNTRPLEPDRIRTMSATEIAASGDDQLLRAMEVLSGR